MKPVIKSVTSPDFMDFSTFQPENRENFSFLLDLTIGLKGEEGGNDFSLNVVTPLWLMENYQKIDVVFGRHTLIVFQYDMENILREIRNKIESIEGNSWDEIASKISRIAHWEFEDYKPN
jgi:hypothetical protein